MLGSRSIVADGWKATTDHVSKGVVDEEALLEGSRAFADDTWSLFRLGDDFSESHDVAGDHPAVLAELRERWAAEAGRNQVYPLTDELIGRIAAVIMPPNPPGPRMVYRPEGGPVPDESVARFFGGFRITVDVDVPDGEAAGVLCAIGDWTGGCALFVRDGRLVFALNRAGDATTVSSDTTVSPGHHLLACEYAPGAAPSLTLFEDGRVLANATLPFPVPMVWQHGGTMMSLGQDRGLPVCEDYEVPFPWTGTLHEVVVETGAAARRAEPAEVRAALHHE